MVLKRTKHICGVVIGGAFGSSGNALFVLVAKERGSDHRSVEILRYEIMDESLTTISLLDVHDGNDFTGIALVNENLLAVGIPGRKILILNWRTSEIAHVCSGSYPFRMGEDTFGFVLLEEARKKRRFFGLRSRTSRWNMRICQFHCGKRESESISVIAVDRACWGLANTWYLSEPKVLLLALHLESPPENPVKSVATLHFCRLSDGTLEATRVVLPGPFAR